MSSVGISFDCDRIYDNMLELNKFPAELATAPSCSSSFGEEEALHWVKAVAAGA
ncbi:MAG: hypothetical protein IPM12_14885 [Flavobacteriales bacterium]|nr:hypothetical protein [Flavobacteriales bacterium]